MAITMSRIYWWFQTGDVKWACSFLRIHLISMTDYMKCDNNNTNCPKPPLSIHLFSTSCSVNFFFFFASTEQLWLSSLHLSLSFILALLSALRNLQLTLWSTRPHAVMPLMRCARLFPSRGDDDHTHVGYLAQLTSLGSPITHTHAQIWIIQESAHIHHCLPVLP